MAGGPSYDNVEVGWEAGVGLYGAGGDHSGGSVYLNTYPAGACTVTASSDQPWLSMIGPTKTSNGQYSDTWTFTWLTQNYSVSNLGATVSYTVNGSTLGYTTSFYQAAPPNCTYSVSVSNTNFPAGGGTGTITVTATPANGVDPSTCTWSVSADQPWVSGYSTTTFAGSGTAGFTVSAPSSTVFPAANLYVPVKRL